MLEVINVIVAGLGAFAFGSVWYMTLAKRWIAESGVETGEDGQPTNGSDPMTYITGLICGIIVAGMMRHVFSLAGIDTVDKGLVAGLGIGAFMAAPWLVTNYTFAGRSRALMLIDGGYATLGCAIIGLILTLF